MSFFDKPILNSPYDPPSRHWELDDDGHPTEQVLKSRRSLAIWLTEVAPQMGLRGNTFLDREANDHDFGRQPHGAET